MSVSDNNRTDDNLFRRVAAGDEEAFTRIFHLYTPRLYPYILKFTKEEHLAKEFVQETFLRLWVNRQDLERIANPASWLFRIAANLCLGHLRTAASHDRLQQLFMEKNKTASLTVAEELEEKELELIIHGAVNALPAQRREVYRLSREEGLSHQEIADRMGIAVNTVKNHLGLALRSIQEYLQQHTGLSLVVLALLLSC